jgi:hypothetical protein
MTDRKNDPGRLCTVCNARSGTFQHLEVTDGEGETRQFELVLCPECRIAFEEDERTTVAPLPGNRLVDQ